MNRIILGLVLLALACGASEDTAESDIGQTEQALTNCPPGVTGIDGPPVTAACLSTSTGVARFSSDQNGDRCDVNNSSKICYLNKQDFGFEIALTTGWTAADRADWGNSQVTGHQFMTNQFSTWQHGGLLGDYFDFEPNGWFTNCDPVGTEPCNFQHMVEMIKVTRPTPSWWANRATTQGAPVNDLVGIACASLKRVLTDSVAAQVVQCDRWTVQVDYDKVKAWASARGVSKINLLNSILKKSIARAIGFGWGPGGTTVMDRNLYPAINPTAWNCGSEGCEVTWGNDYFSGLDTRPGVGCGQSTIVQCNSN